MTDSGQLLFNAFRYPTYGQAWRQILGDDTVDLVRAGETLDPILDIFSRIEFALPRQEYWFAQTNAIAAVAGNLGQMAIAIPANSGFLAVVYASVRSGVAQAHQFGFSTNASVIASGLGQGAPVALDGRRAPVTLVVPGALASAGAPAAPIVFTAQVDQVQTAAAADVDKPFRIPIVIKPGQAAMVQETTVNTAVTISMWGYVQPVQPLVLAPR